MWKCHSLLPCGAIPRLPVWRASLPTMKHQATTSEIQNMISPKMKSKESRAVTILLLLVLAFFLNGPMKAGEPGDSSKASFDVNRDQDSSSQKSADPSALFFPAGQFQIGAFGSGGF